ncbi:hypothetical protein KL905_000200 [Ogataea polymorpha]|nr:hypothetical protein KL908_001313 [Ogataea polymorpha]KAG7902554.1 hypothetical protein KL935_001462 [Ogataea polymorpha]KAG7924046.1 hypothetical protein KL905_000200 [Ogataea polymorpha]
MFPVLRRAVPAASRRTVSKAPYTSQSYAESLVASLQNPTLTKDLKRKTLLVLLRNLRNGQSVLSQPLINSLFGLWLPFFRDKEVQSCLLDGGQSKELTSMLVQSYTLKGEYELALDAIQKSPLVVDRFPCELLAYHLIVNKQFDKAFQLVDLLYTKRYPQILNQQILELLVKSSLDDGRIELVSKFVVGFVFLFDRPLMNLSDELAGRLARLSIERLDFATFAKTVDYQTKRLMLTDKTGATQFRHQMELLRFKGYVAKLGAERVIESGIFFNLRFLESECHVTDFPTLTHDLAQTIGSHLNLHQAIVLIEQMNGYHLKEHHERYSPALHPDHQLYRMMKHKSDPEIKFEDLKGDYSQHMSSVGKPNRKSHKYRMRKAISSKPFSVLPLNIMLKTISESSNNFRLAMELVNSMIRKRRCELNEESLYYMLKISTASETINVDLFTSLLDSFDIRPTAKSYHLMFDMLIKTGRVELLRRYYDEYKTHNHYVSREMHRKISALINI